jgi:nicotinamidase/pyrazinamidase
LLLASFFESNPRHAAYYDKDGNAVSFIGMSALSMDNATEPSSILRIRPASDVLLIIDMQNDFLPGGALAVRDGDAIIGGINELMHQFDHVIFTQDWHPADHISFASSHNKQPFTDTIETAYGTQRLWPDHCVQGSPGAELSSAMEIQRAELILRKGFRREIDSYSAFTENDAVTPTGLAGYLRERGFRRIFLAGLAYDFCVGFSALAAVRLGFEALVVEDLSRAVDPQSSAPAMNQEFAAEGVQRVSSTEIVHS